MILRSYRHDSGLTQQALAEILGYDRTYISMIECGRRRVTDHKALAHIARTLAISPHVLGIADPDNPDFSAMLNFGTSVIRLADIARHSGRSVEAVTELWPLIAQLQARIVAGYAAPEIMRLLAMAQVSIGVALGQLLPEERLATAARWTGRALRIASDLGDRQLLAFVLRMHGNELRKAGYAPAAIIRLQQALQIDDHPARKGAGLVLLARAAAQSGQADLFDAVARQCVAVLRSTPDRDVLLNTFTIREVRLRGLLATGRTGQAVDLAGNSAADDRPPTPQWQVIERITTADVLARARDERAAASMLSEAISEAETLRLPHQVQRITRLTSLSGPAMESVQEQARAALVRLDRQLVASGSGGDLDVMRESAVAVRS
jgi:transcriptional regulator with XRE-family HTH domain